MKLLVKLIRLTLKNRIFWQTWGDDGRKIGIASIVAGLLVMFSVSDKITESDSLLLIKFGVLIWVLSAILFSISSDINRN